MTDAQALPTQARVVVIDGSRIVLLASVREAGSCYLLGANGQRTLLEV